MGVVLTSAAAAGKADARSIVIEIHAEGKHLMKPPPEGTGTPIHKARVECLIRLFLFSDANLKIA
jgi:hypothetical protein